MKVLVIGHARSGTTMLRRLIQQHPNIHAIFHEVFIISKHRKDKKKIFQWIDNRNLEGKNWGEKVPYLRVVRQGIGPIQYYRLWQDLFKDDAKVIHIVRHPYDSALSLKKKKSRKGQKTNLKMVLKRYKNVVPLMVKDIFSNENCMNVKYEELVLHPIETLTEIYKFCGLRYDSKIVSKISNSNNLKFGGINSDRVFSYKKEGFSFEFDKEELFEILNEIKGVKYE